MTRKDYIAPLQWFGVEVKVPGRPMHFIGKVYTTLEDIEQTLGPYLTITGDLVTIWGRPND